MRCWDPHQSGSQAPLSTHPTDTVQVTVPGFLLRLFNSQAQRALSSISELAQGHILIMRRHCDLATSSDSNSVLNGAVRPS